MIHSIYNYWKNKHELKIYFGEEICVECKGTGVRIIPFSIDELHFMCRLCHGNGKVDWVSRIMRSRK